ncbi:MAG: DUF1186 domain-containing protein, partial [Parachlamydiaceae bacterium]
MDQQIEAVDHPESSKAPPFLSPFKAVHSVTQEEYNAICNMDQKERIQLLTFLRKNIESLCQGEDVDDPDELLTTMLILGHLQEPEAFLPLLALTKVDADVCEELFSGEFLFEDWPHLLYSTANGRWELLKEQIEENRSEFHTSGLLGAACFMVGEGQLPREVLIAFIKERFRKIITQKLDHVNGLGYWLKAALMIWPDECLEEIKELFGLRLVDTSFISIDDVLKDHASGPEVCLLKAKAPTSPLVSVLTEESEKEIEERETKIWETLKRLISLQKAEDKKQNSLNQPKGKLGRNDPCPCGSGKKYKRCCLGHEQAAQENVRTETYMINNERMGQDQISEEDAELSKQLYYKIQSEPEECVETLLQLIKKYPTHPSYYNHLYVCYTKLERYWDAHEMLMNTVKQFPDYLFGLIELASYYLRRGDYEQVPKLFKNCY